MSRPGGMTTLADHKRRRIDELTARTSEAGGVSLIRDAGRRLLHDPAAIVGAVIILIFLIIAIFAP
ncbi:MAG: ABC transporter permease, partial [Actinoplanes sp.]